MNLQQLISPKAASRAQWEQLTWGHPFAPGRKQPDADWMNWLTDGSSLTQRLKQASDQQFRVQLLQQRLLRPALNESRLLGLGSQEFALVRQVILYGRDQPWVFARTVIPLSTLQQGNRHLMLLGNRSLGSVLFKNRTTQRVSKEITAAHAGFCTSFVWGRRSVFEIRTAPLLVTELFLEPFRRHLRLQPLV